MKNEIWKDVPGYEDYYQVSDYGNVFSKERNINIIDKFNRSYSKTIPQKILKTYIDVYGYRIVDFRVSNKRKTFSVHKLVAMTFLNHKPCGYVLVIDHIDNNKLNNKVSNLRIVTSRENSTKDKKGTTSSFMGVSFEKSRKKFKVIIQINSNNIHLGRFKNEKTAGLYYTTAFNNLQYYNGNNKEFRDLIKSKL